MTESHLVPSSPGRPNWARAGVKVIPYIGEALDELLFAKADEARLNRIEQTLAELGEMLRAHGVPADEVNKEEFAGLLEALGPVISRATSEQKRRFLRDLLFNSVQLKTGEVEWESARLAGELIAPLEAPALAILAALNQVKGKALIRPTEGGSSAEVAAGGPNGTVSLPYPWLVVDQAYRQLSENSSARLVVLGGRGSHGVETWLTDLGQFVLRWAQADSSGS
jgi:hypothetical protein